MKAEISAAMLGLDLSEESEKALFGWFLASYLFGKRISQDIAARTWRVLFEAHRCDTPLKLIGCGRQGLVRILREGRYTRYDESTAERLLEVCQVLQVEYGGRILGIKDKSESRSDFERRVLAFKGVGSKTLEIFMREAGPVLFR
jgi:endonuclease III